MKEEFVFILDDFRILPSLIKSSFTTLQALSVTRRLGGPCYTLYLHHPSSELNWTGLHLLPSSCITLSYPHLTPETEPPSLLIMHHSAVNMGQMKRRPFFFFSPQFSEMKMTSRSYPKFLSRLGSRKRSPFFFFKLILFFLDAAPAFVFVFF